MLSPRSHTGALRCHLASALPGCPAARTTQVDACRPIAVPVSGANEMSHRTEGILIGLAHMEGHACKSRLESVRQVRQYRAFACPVSEGDGRATVPQHRQCVVMANFTGDDGISI